MSRKKALLVDDDTSLKIELQPEFDALSYDLDYADNGIIGLEMALSGEYHIILLDIELPGLEGVEICKKIRENLDTPIIMLSQKADELSKVLLLEIGADDYITKPYAVRELKARVKALMRRIERGSVEHSQSPELDYRGLKIDFNARKVTLNQMPVELTSTEYDILALLASAPGKPYSREDLLVHIYGFDATNYSRSITNHINRIRSKIEVDSNKPVFILTVRGHGYRFSDLSQE